MELEVTRTFIFDEEQARRECRRYVEAPMPEYMHQERLRDIGGFWRVLHACPKLELHPMEHQANELQNPDADAAWDDRSRRRAAGGGGVRPLSEIERDARRYRWLRSSEAGFGGWPNPGTPIVAIIELDKDGRRYPMSCDEVRLDAAIDAAIQAGESDV